MSEASKNSIGGIVYGQGGHIPFNFQSTHPGGAVEKKRLQDCEVLYEMLAVRWANTSELARMLGWSRRRVRETIRAMRGAVEHERRIGPKGAEEDRWRLQHVNEIEG